MKNENPVLLNLLGEAWLGDKGNMYLCVCEGQHHAQDMMKQFAELVVSEGYTYADNKERGNDRLFVGDKDHLVQVFLFWSVESNLKNRGRCHTFARIFFDISPESEHKYREDIEDIRKREKP